MPLRIGFDMDGVFADMEGALVRQAQDIFGEAVAGPLRDGNLVEAEGEAGETTAADEPSVGRLRMTARQQRRLWHHVERIEDFWATLDELEPGVLGRLAAVAAEQRWEIIFLTKRPPTAGCTSQVQTQRWLAEKGFPMPSVFVVQGSRGRIAAALDLDFVIDDRPENCLDVVVDSKARAILVWREDPQRLPAAARRLGIGVVKSVSECIEILKQIDSPAAEKPGVLNRLMQMLGLRHAAGA